jgi:tetratricopeptide (TPR) repeat protein
MSFFALNAGRFSLSAAVCALYLFAGADTTPDKLIEQGHFKRAKTALSGYLQQHPDDPRANFQMSKVFVAFLEPDESIRHAEKAVSADDKNDDFHTQLAEAIALKLISNDTGFFEKVPLITRFRKEIDLALQLNPKSVRANSDLVQFYLSAPALLGGSRDKAKETAERLAQWDPLAGYLMSAKVAAAEGADQEAVERILQQAAKQGPKNYDAQFALADFYARAHKTGLAAEYARKSVQIDPQRAAAYNILAAAYAEQRDWRQLRELLPAAERNVSDDLGPYLQSARTILLNDISDQFPLAETYFRKYLSQEPEALEPPLSRVHWRLGQLLQKQGRKEEAKKEFQLALRLEPGLKEAQQDLKNLP